MKRRMISITVLIFALLMALSLASCSESDDDSG